MSPLESGFPALIIIWNLSFATAEVASNTLYALSFNALIGINIPAPSTEAASATSLRVISVNAGQIGAVPSATPGTI